MTNFTTVLAGLVLIVTEGTVEGSELTELVALELVLAFGNRSGLYVVSVDTEEDFRKTYSLDDVVDELLGLVDLLLCVRHDQAVQILLLVAGVCCVRASLTLLDRALATNRDLRARLRLHFL